VPFPFGPVTGMLRSASPASLFVLTLPMGKPSSIGVPKAATTLSFAFARASAVWYGSDDLSTFDIPEMRPKIPTPKTAMASTMPIKEPRQQPVGRNHFQFRLHQPGRGA